MRGRAAAVDAGLGALHMVVTLQHPDADAIETRPDRFADDSVADVDVLDLVQADVADVMVVARVGRRLEGEHGRGGDHHRQAHCEHEAHFGEHVPHRHFPFRPFRP